MKILFLSSYANNAHFIEPCVESLNQNLINCEFELNSIDDVSSFHTLFIKSNYKLLSTSSDLILSIYDKVNELNIIEKYILYKKVYRVRNIEKPDLSSFFEEFLTKGK